MGGSVDRSGCLDPFPTPAPPQHGHPPQTTPGLADRASPDPDARLPRLCSREHHLAGGNLFPRSQDGPARVPGRGGVYPLSKLARLPARLELLRPGLLRCGRPGRPGGRGRHPGVVPDRPRGQLRLGAFDLAAGRGHRGPPLREGGGAGGGGPGAGDRADDRLLGHDSPRPDGRRPRRARLLPGPRAGRTGPGPGGAGPGRGRLDQADRRDLPGHGRAGVGRRGELAARPPVDPGGRGDARGGGRRG